MYIHTYLQYVHSWIHTSTYIHTYIHIYIHACMHACMHTYIHIYIHLYIHPYIHTYILLPLEPACLPQPSMEGNHPPNPGTLSNLLSSIEYRPGRRTPRRMGLQTIAGTWIKRSGPGACTTLVKRPGPIKCKHRLVHCMMCIHDESPLLVCKTNLVSTTWSETWGAATSHIIRQANVVLPCPPREGWIIATLQL